MKGDVKLKTVNVIILSGACCNPSLVYLDEKVQTRIKEIAEKTQTQVTVSIVPISVAAFGGLGLSKETDTAIKSLLAEKGMSVLPVVIFNEMIVFYGGLASAAIVEEKLTQRTNGLEN